MKGKQSNWVQSACLREGLQRTVPPLERPLNSCLPANRRKGRKGRWDWKWFNITEILPILSENSRVLPSQPFRWILAHINKVDISLWIDLARWIFRLLFVHRLCGVFCDEMVFVWDELSLTGGPSLSSFARWSGHRPPFWQSITLEFVDVPVFTSVWLRYYEFTSTLTGEWAETAICDE